MKKHWLLVVAVAFSAWSVGVQAQAGVDVLAPSHWTPATALAVASVVFSFGISYQRIRVHAKDLARLEEWRIQTVDPQLGVHAVEIARLQTAITKQTDGHRRA